MSVVQTKKENHRNRKKRPTQPAPGRDWKKSVLVSDTMNVRNEKKNCDCNSATLK